MGRLLASWGKLHKMTEELGSCLLECRLAVLVIWPLPADDEVGLRRQPWEGSWGFSIAVMRKAGVAGGGCSKDRAHLPHLIEYHTSLFPDSSETHRERLCLNFSQVTAFWNGYQAGRWQQPKARLPNLGAICSQIGY